MENIPTDNLGSAASMVVTPYGDKDAKRRLIAIKISSERRDEDGEIVRQDGMELDDYFMKRGRLKWEHREYPSDKAIIGFPIGFQKLPTGQKDTVVVGELYRNRPLSDSVWSLLHTIDEQGGAPVGASIEGQYKLRSPDGDVKRSRVVNVVLTANPKNIDTRVSIVKSNINEIEEKGWKQALTLLKQLTATPISTVLSEKVGGDALIGDTQKKKKKGENNEEGSMDAEQKISKDEEKIVKDANKLAHQKSIELTETYREKFTVMSKSMDLIDVSITQRYIAEHKFDDVDRIFIKYDNNNKED